MDGMLGSHRMGKVPAFIALATVISVMTAPAKAFW